jgi:chromosome segregation ATPase
MEDTQSELEILRADLAACRKERDHWLTEATRRNQELAELRERYPDALLQAEDLARQVGELQATVQKLEIACQEAMRKSDDHRRQRDALRSMACT